MNANVRWGVPGERVFADLAEDWSPADVLDDNLDVVLQTGGTKAGRPVVCIRGRTKGGREIVVRVTGRMFLAVAELLRVGPPPQGGQPTAKA